MKDLKDISYTRGSLASREKADLVAKFSSQNLHLLMIYQCHWAAAKSDFASYPVISVTSWFSSLFYSARLLVHVAMWSKRCYWVCQLSDGEERSGKTTKSTETKKKNSK